MLMQDEILYLNVTASCRQIYFRNRNNKKNLCLQYHYFIEKRHGYADKKTSYSVFLDTA